jgi:hypothetical protein
MQSADEFRAQAERCRRVARSISDRDDPIVARLFALAIEYDAKALEMAAADNSGEEPSPPAASEPSQPS